MSKMKKAMWDDYLKWMLDRIGFNKKRYYRLVRYLHSVPFEVSGEALMDENRAGDGLYLRKYFFRDMGIVGYDSGYGCTGGDVDFDRGCSVAEMLVAFAERINEEYLGFDYGGFAHPDRIFMMFLTNLRLDEYTSGEYRRRSSASIEREIDEKLSVFMGRMYKNDGVGGLFPLRRSVSGYNKMELFRQMNIYFDKFRINCIDDLSEMDEIK